MQLLCAVLEIIFTGSDVIGFMIYTEFVQFYKRVLNKVQF